MNISNLLLACILLNIFAYLTIRIRPYIYGVTLYKPMIWNFKLSLLPFLIQLLSLVVILSISYLSSLLKLTWLYSLGIFLFILFQGIWLVFLPNATYLITELNLSHRQADTKEVPIWYDIVSVLSFALSGILNTLMNIGIILLEILIFIDPETITQAYKYNLLLAMVILTVLVTVGVYLGRSIRFNSWDLMHPIKFGQRLYRHLNNKKEFINFLLFVFFHTILLLILAVAFGFISLL